MMRVTLEKVSTMLRQVILCLCRSYVSFSRSNSRVDILDKIHDRGPDDFGRFPDFS